MIQDIFIVGATGKVGSSLARQITEMGDNNPKIHSNPTRIVGLASSEYFIYEPRGIPQKKLQSFVEKDFTGSIHYSDFKEIIMAAEIGTREDSSSLVFVDTTAAQMAKFHLHLMKNTPYGIVTANKNPISFSDFKTFQELTKHVRRYGYRCSVMAGSDAIPFLRDLRDMNEPLCSIYGCFSGTLGYISSELEKNRKFSEILQEAREKGYTEPDPRDDLSGLDVARKLTVLARTAGFNVNMEDVKLAPFIPENYFGAENANEFIEKSKELDLHFQQKVDDARKNDSVLRYVAAMKVEGERAFIQIGLREEKKSGSLGTLTGTANKIIIATSKTYTKDSPYIIECPGAGLEVTASNIRRDLMYMLPSREASNHNGRK